MAHRRRAVFRFLPSGGRIPFLGMLIRALCSDSDSIGVTRAVFSVRTADFADSADQLYHEMLSKR